MVPPLYLVRPYRQRGLRAVDRLDLTFLIDAQNHGAFRRVQIEPNDVAHLVDEQRVGWIT